MPASNRPPEFSQAAALINDLLLIEEGIASTAVAVARGGEIIWEEGFGWADREGRAPATEHTVYSLASISKPITATGLMLLVERGLIALDAPVNDYLGDCGLVARVGKAEEATVRRVAAHAAGLPTHYQFFYEDEPRCRPPMSETIRRYGNIVVPPGEEYRYSNLGYGILDYAISRLSGKSYPDFMREEVFLPLGMTRSSVHLAPDLEKYAAARYGRDGKRLPFYDFDHPGGSAVWASAHDLIRFAMFHLGKRLPDQRQIISPASIVEAHRPVISIGERRHYALGWAVDGDRHGHRALHHGGDMGGVSTFLILLPDEYLAVAVLTNGKTRSHLRVADEIISALLPAYTANRAREGAEQKKEDATGTGSNFTPTPALLGGWRGHVHTYEGGLPLALDFHPDGDVHARLGNQLETLVNEPSFEKGTFTGKMAGDLLTEDTRGHHCLELYLKLSGGSLAGSVTATAFPWHSGGRVRNATSHWTRLEREQ